LYLGSTFRNNNANVSFHLLTWYKAGVPLNGQPAHRKASPKWHLPQLEDSSTAWFYFFNSSARPQVQFLHGFARVTQSSALSFIILANREILKIGLRINLC
jgi:hypothetical protein